MQLCAFYVIPTRAHSCTEAMQECTEAGEEGTRRCGWRNCLGIGRAGLEVFAALDMVGIWRVLVFVVASEIIVRPK